MAPRSRNTSVWCALAVGTVLALNPADAAAHEVRSAHLQLTETQPGQFTVLWKVPTPPAGHGAAGPPAILFPARWQTVQPIRTMQLPGSFLQQWVVATGAQDIAGETIQIRGLAKGFNTLVSIRWSDGRVFSAVLRPDQLVLVIPGRESAARVASSYVWFGAEHILLGFDHLLFVFALLLIARGRWVLVKIITAFTLAHSLTLSLAVLDVVRLPQPPVEASIALSILLLAAELARGSAGEGTLPGKGLAVRAPWLVSFAFGLLHGFGFAGALREVGLPQSAVPLALAMFNVGVELGQLLFVSAVWGLVGLARWARVSAPVELRPIVAYAIGSLAAFWFLDRLVALF